MAKKEKQQHKTGHKNTITSNNIVRQEFNYRNEESNTDLNFVLRVDKPIQLEAFRGLMVLAMADIDKILEGLKAK